MSEFQLTEAGRRDLARYLPELLGEGEGWACLGYIDGDPREQGTGMREEWVYYGPDQLDALVARIKPLVARYGNVYAGLCLFDRRKRSYETALPSRWVWTDDVKRLEQSFSMVVGTSEGNYQVYHRLDSPVDAKVRSDLQRRARHAMNGDTSSADATKMVRLPGGYNTKGGGCYPVRLVSVNGQTYTVSNLEGRWPKVRPRATDVVAEVDWAAAAAYQKRIGLYCRVVDGRRIPERVRQGTQTWHVLTMQLKRLPPKVGLYKGDGSPNWSQMRAVVAHGLRAVGYPDPFIAAFLLEECDYGRSDRGQGELEKDIARVIGLAHEQYPDGRITVRDPRAVGDGARVVRRVGDTRPAAESAPGTTTPAADRRFTADSPRVIVDEKSGSPRTSRQQKLTAAALLEWYRDNAVGDRVPYTQMKTAEALGCGVATVRRRDAELTRAGLIQRVTYGQRQHSYVLLLPPALEPPPDQMGDQDVLSEPQSDGQTPGDGPAKMPGDGLRDVLSPGPQPVGNAAGCVDAGVPEGESGDSRPGGVCLKSPEVIARPGAGLEPGQVAEKPVCASETGVPARTRVAAPSLSDLVAEAFDAYEGRSLRFADVLAYVRANSTECWPELAVRRAYQARQKLRKRQHDEERINRKVRALSWAALKAFERSTGSRAEELERGQKPGWRQAMWLAGQVAAEVRRREEARERTRQRREAADEQQPRGDG